MWAFRSICQRQTKKLRRLRRTKTTRQNNIIFEESHTFWSINEKTVNDNFDTIIETTDFFMRKKKFKCLFISIISLYDLLIDSRVKLIFFFFFSFNILIMSNLSL